MPKNFDAKKAAADSLLKRDAADETILFEGFKHDVLDVPFKWPPTNVSGDSNGSDYFDQLNRFLREMQLTAAVAQNYSGSLNRDVIGDIAKDLYHELTQILQLADSGKTSEAVSRLRQLLAVKEGPSYSPEQLAYYKEIKTQEENKRVADERQKQMLITKVAKLGAGNRRSEVK